MVLVTGTEAHTNLKVEMTVPTKRLAKRIALELLKSGVLESGVYMKEMTHEEAKKAGLR